MAERRPRDRSQVDPGARFRSPKETESMDQTTFDALTRSVVSEAGTRRAVVRLLAGTVLGALTAHLSPAEGAAGKAKRHSAKAKSAHQEPGHRSPKRRGQADPHQNAARGVQSEGKHKGKDKGKHHKQTPQDPTPLPPLPPGCEGCNECQMCQDGACVPDSALAGVPCLGSGATCSHCLLGVCTANEQLPCPDGICVRRGQCCSGEKYCSDPESSTGFSCIDPTGCCPSQKKCSNTCVSISACCPGEKRCGGGPCVSDATC